MRFDKTMTLIGEVQIDDGMGGYEVQDKAIRTVNVFTTPINAEVARREYGIVTKQSLKAFTKEDIPSEVGSVELNGAVYSVVLFNDFGRKMKMLVIARES
ncbi:hypothetical protein LCM23_06735 [Cytobacillus kochii]|uniref:hypothetical protein n=1 Tax=Cytobacillus kochii TaxID=859143 RepID=UPI001CD6CB5E|nr:hypothetical protein [Cytobacillus kochii]MCA1025783.1 hypothetical protein [Cytobacillus kochii]